MSDIGLLFLFFGIEFKTLEICTVMHQTKYATDLLKKFNMFKCNSTITPTETRLVLEKERTKELINPTYFKQIVGSLKYLCNTRLDLGFSVGLKSRFMEIPKRPYLLAIKRIMWHVKWTLYYRILFPKGSHNSEV